MSINQNRRKIKERRGNLFFSKQDSFERRRNPDRRCDGFEISTIFLSDDAFLSFTQEYLLENTLDKDFDNFNDQSK